MCTDFTEATRNKIFTIQVYVGSLGDDDVDDDDDLVGRQGGVRAF